MTSHEHWCNLSGGENTLTVLRSLDTSCTAQYAHSQSLYNDTLTTHWPPPLPLHNRQFIQISGRIIRLEELLTNVLVIQLQPEPSTFICYMNKSKLTVSSGDRRSASNRDSMITNLYFGFYSVYRHLFQYSNHFSLQTQRYIG